MRPSLGLRLLCLASLAALACGARFDPDARAFACERDEDCASGRTCDLQLGRCLAVDPEQCTPVGCAQLVELATLELQPGPNPVPLVDSLPPALGGVRLRLRLVATADQSLGVFSRGARCLFRPATGGLSINGTHTAPVHGTLSVAPGDETLVTFEDDGRHLRFAVEHAASGRKASLATTFDGGTDVPLALISPGLATMPGDDSVLRVEDIVVESLLGHGCASWSCADGTCAISHATAGTPCDDRSACTTGDACDAQGRCGGEPLVCQGTGSSLGQHCDPDAGCVALTPAPDGPGPPGRP